MFLPFPRLNLIFKKSPKIRQFSLVNMFLVLGLLLNAQLSNADIEATEKECIEQTSSQVLLNNFRLHIPYVQLDGIFYHTEFDFLGTVNQKSRWKLVDAVVVSNPPPSPCFSTVNLNGDLVVLEDVVAIQNDIFTDTHYSANLFLVSNKNGVFLNLIDFSIKPQEVELVLAFATSESMITLAWDAKDSKVKTMNYLVYASSDSDFKVDDSSLVKTIRDVRQTVLTNLIKNTEYFIKIVTEDIEGNQSIVSNKLSVRTFSSAMLLNTTETIEQSEELNLNEVSSIDENTIVFALKKGTESSPAVGSILVGETGKGGYLRKIHNITQNNGQLLLNTSKASLSDILDVGGLSSSILLKNISVPIQKTGQVQRSKKTADSNYVSHLKWDDDLFEITQINHFHNNNELTITPSSNGRSFTFDINSEVDKQNRTLTNKISNEVSIDLTIDFEPELQTNVDWGVVSLNSAKVSANGKLMITLDADFDFTGKVDYKSAPKRLFTRTFNAKYLIASVPVWQVTTFTLDAIVTASAASAVNAGVHTEHSTFVFVGSEYDGDKWSSISNSIKFKNTITADISIKGKVNAEIRLIPNIEIRFYETIGANLSIEPFLGGGIAAESALHADFINSLFPGFVNQMTEFDFGFGLECFINVDLDVIFSTFPVLDKTKVCGKGTFTGAIESPLFSLPKLTVMSEKKGSQIVATAEVSDGINNPFDIDSIQWFIEPAGPKLNVTTKKMTFVPEKGIDEYLVFFSGNGTLGSIARQFVHTTQTTVTSPDALSGEWRISVRGILMGQSCTGESIVDNIDDTLIFNGAKLIIPSIGVDINEFTLRDLFSSIDGEDGTFEADDNILERILSVVNLAGDNGTLNKPNNLIISFDNGFLDNRVSGFVLFIGKTVEGQVFTGDNNCFTTWGFEGNAL